MTVAYKETSNLLKSVYLIRGTHCNPFVSILIPASKQPHLGRVRMESINYEREEGRKEIYLTNGEWQKINSTAAAAP